MRKFLSIKNRQVKESLEDSQIPTSLKKNKDILIYAMLKESEMCYRRLFESAKDGILILDAESGIILDVNPFLIELLGYTKEQFLEKKIWDIGILKDIIANQDNFLELQKKEYIRYEDLPIETSDGRKIEVEFVSNIYSVNHHKVIQCNIRDITERKLAEKVLKESEERFRHVSSTISDISYSCITNKDGIYSINWMVGGAEKITGYSIDEIKAKHCWGKLVIDEDLALFEKNVIQLTPGSFGICELRLQHKNGGIVWITSYAECIIEKEQPIHSTIYGGLVDITERKKAEEALASEQYLMFALMNNVPDRIYFKDRASRFIRISKAQAQLFGLRDPAQAVSKTDFDFFTEEHARQAYEDEQEIIRTGLPVNKEEKETWPDRTDTWVYSTKLPLRDKEGNIIGTFGISIDITVRKETELMLMQKNQEIESQNEEFLALNDELEQTNKELLLAKEKAEESDRLKTAFLQNMSHEIRTPMNGILGFAELLRNTSLPEIKQQEFIGIIEKSGQRMLNIISDIVNISKIETDQIELDLKETNVNSILQHLHLFFSPDAEKKGLRLTFKPGLSDDLCKIETDDVKLTQVLSNLINNALKFTKTGTIDFGYQRKGKMIEFCVLDTGIGIAPENQDIIFERFRQVDVSDARNYEGAGLGLSISKAFVEKLGGKIWMKSELNKGTSFFFNIPYNPKVTIRTEKPSEAGLEAKFLHINILLVEDDEVCMELLKETLENEKANLFFAKNGLEALDIVKSTPEIHLVLMDLKMPVMNGFEATRLIKRLKPDLPVIAQSAYAFSNDQDKARIAGCDDFIGKPVVRQLLLTKINKQLLKK